MMGKINIYFTKFSKYGIIIRNFFYEYRLPLYSWIK